MTAGTSAIAGWTVTWQFANGQTVAQSWNATITASGTSVTGRNVTYNGALGAGASICHCRDHGWVLAARAGAVDTYQSAGTLGLSQLLTIAARQAVGGP